MDQTTINIVVGIAGALFQKLDRSEEKVDAKADKRSGILHGNGK